MRRKPQTEKVAFHSHRPFLVIDIYRRPSATAKPSRKGWSLLPDAWELTENPFVVDRVTTKHLRNASAIIDIFARTLVKNRFADASPADVYAHYSEKYQDKITAALALWHRREGTLPVMAALPPARLHDGITVTM
jgi:hypothetical protein